MAPLTKYTKGPRAIMNNDCFRLRGCSWILVLRATKVRPGVLPGHPIHTSEGSKLVLSQRALSEFGKQWGESGELGLGHSTHVLELYPVIDDDKVQSERRSMKGWAKIASESQESSEFKTQEGEVSWGNILGGSRSCFSLCLLIFSNAKYLKNYHSLKPSFIHSFVHIPELITGEC